VAERRAGLTVSHESLDPRLNYDQHRALHGYVLRISGKRELNKGAIKIAWGGAGGVMDKGHVYRREGGETGGRGGAG